MLAATWSRCRGFPISTARPPGFAIRTLPSSRTTRTATTFGAGSFSLGVFCGTWAHADPPPRSRTRSARPRNLSTRRTFIYFFTQTKPSAVPTCSNKSLREYSLRVRVGCLDRHLAQIVGTALAQRRCLSGCHWSYQEEDSKAGTLFYVSHPLLEKYPAKMCLECLGAKRQERSWPHEPQNADFHRWPRHSDRQEQVGTALAGKSAAASRRAHGRAIQVLAQIHEREKGAQHARLQVIRQVQAAGRHPGQAFPVFCDEPHDFALPFVRRVPEGRLAA